MKIRNNYVSNSSSSSFIIECKGQALAEYVEEAYGKVFDLWMELNPDDLNDNLDRNNFHIVSIEEIIEHFKNYYMKEEDLRHNIEYMKKEQKNGYVFVLGTCTSDDGTCEYNIVSAFNEYFLHCLQGEYDWKNNQYKRDINLIFETRWS